MVEVREADDGDLDRWNGLVDRSPHGTPFHYREFVDVVAGETDSDPHFLIGYAGQEPVGVFPVYERKLGPVTAVFSPPPDRQVTYHGPALVNLDKLKRRKRDSRQSKFLEGALESIESEISPRFTHFRTSSRFCDARPFDREGFELGLGYTYVVDLSPGADALLDSFSSDARRNVREGEDVDYEVTLGDVGDVRRIVQQVKARHDAQGESYSVTPSYVTDLYRSLPEGTLRPYVCHVEGEYAGGIVALDGGDTVYRWQGGVKLDADAPVNDLLDWHVICDAIERGRSRYDMVGAHKPSIARYKAKFAPELECYLELESGTPALSLAADVYRLLKK